jgi:hypothetical protein
VKTRAAQGLAFGAPLFSFLQIDYIGHRQLH